MKTANKNLRASKIIANASLAMALVFGAAAAVAGGHCDKIDEANVPMSDVKASNGVIHVIDRDILPS